jgi:pimeloyl-ACP methyl ester carboxylesterase
MKHLKLLLVAIFILLPAVCRAADDGYGYPIPGSYEATILGTPDELKSRLPTEIPVKQLVLDVFPDRTKPPIFYYDEGLRCSFAYQKQKAPLVFLIAGTGSSNQSPKLVSMMKELYKAGYHVITLPSPTHPNFIISASLGSVPGDLAEDARDLYRAMETAWNRVRGDIEVTDFSLAGYSLGGTQAAFVAKLDEDRKVFNFRKVLMINPAVSLFTSVSRIEAMLDKIPGGSRKISAFFNRMLARFTEFYRDGDFININNEFLYAVYQSDILSQDEAGGIIALSFRINSAGMIFASDVMTNGGYVVPKNRILANSDSLEDYFRVSVHLGFPDYFKEYFYPYFLKKRPGLTKEALIESESLKSIEGYLKSSPKFGVMTNENDFILAAGELDYLRTLFGERIKVYPRGGHLGNLEYKENMAYMVDFMGFFNKLGGTGQ